jgi:UDP-glucuronate 4-epimerase
MVLNKKKVLVTGSAGFVGHHLVRKLLDEGYSVVGIDNINSYYDVGLKYAKLPLLGIKKDFIWPNEEYYSEIYPDFKFCHLDIKDRYNLEKLFDKEKFDIVCNMAAQAGVQYSISDPHTYIANNIQGFINIIDACRIFKIEHFIYASSSSVYGNRDDVPFKESDNVDNPISLYAASKKSNELIAHTYSHLYNLKTTGLRFFTVYGPFGRPDMAPFIFVKSILENKTIKVFNDGNMERDFTYIDDIVEGMFKIFNSDADYQYKIFNIGNSNPVNIKEFISVIESVLNKKAIIKYAPIREGDVVKTYADVSELKSMFGYTPSTTLIDGVSSFVNWYMDYYDVWRIKSNKKTNRMMPAESM